MCQLDVIRECKKTKLVKRALKTLPKTLDETYERILSRIPDDYVEDVRRVLQCLICAFKPLDIREVADIVAIDTAEPYYDPENRYSSPRDLLSVCSGLVSTRTAKRLVDIKWDRIEFEIEELRLAHFSVKEYLVSDRVNLGPAMKYKLDEVSCHGTLANLCISYLLKFEEEVYDRQPVTKTIDSEARESWDQQSETETDGHFEEDIYDRQSVTTSDPEEIGEEQSETLTDGHFEDLMLCENTPFAPYAAMFWSRHLRAAKLDYMTPLYPKSMKLITDPALIDRIVNYHRAWFDMKVLGFFDYLGINRNRRKDPVTHPLCASISPVYYASALGLDYHVRQLLVAGESANSTGPYGTALAVAARNGHKSTVQLLLKMGANVDAQGVWKKERDGTTILSKTALHSAIDKQCEDIVHVLLDHGAVVNTKLIMNGYSIDPDNNTPLQAALWRGNTCLVQKLLDRGADVTVAGGHLGDALSIACSYAKDVHLVRLLLEKGADPNAPKMIRGNALISAILKSNNKPLQRLLVEYGADVALVNFDYIRSFLRQVDGKAENEIEDYIAETIAMLAQVERRPKPSTAMSDSVE